MTRHWFRKKDGRPRTAGTLFDDAVVMLEERVMLDATPVVTVDAPANVLLTDPGASVDVTLTFDNTGADPGYGPFIELIVPKNGADGADAMTPNTANDDGLTFNGATYLGQPVIVVGGMPITFTDHDNNPGTPAQAINPLTGGVVTGAIGDQLVVLQLPFGSYTGAQTPAAIIANFTLSPFADLGTPLTIAARSGFQYGLDPLDNPGADPVILQPGFVNDTTTPTLATITKVAGVKFDKEAELATGPNNPAFYTVAVDVANGQTLTNVTITDSLPDRVVITSITPSGGGVVMTAPTLGTVTGPGNDSLVVSFASVTGTNAASDASVTFAFYVPDNRFGGMPVIDPVTGAITTTTNSATYSATWTPLDVRDAPTTFGPAMPAVATFQNQPIVIQKTASIVNDTGPAGLNPGDVIEYVLDIQVSDYFSLGDITLTDLLSDGQRLDTSFIPTINLIQRGGAPAAGNLAGVMVGGVAAGDVTTGNEFTGNFASTFSAVTGVTSNTINISQALIDAALDADGVLLGGLVGVAAPGGTTLQVRFRAVVQNSFESDALNMANRAVDQGDTIGNDVSLAASIRSNANAATTLDAQTLRDDATEMLTIQRGGLVKSIYAINGDTNLANFTTNGSLQLKAGDLITYRLEYVLPITSFQSLSFADFLPLPVLVAQDITFNAGAPTFTAGEYAYGPTDTLNLRLNAPDPTDAFDVTGNSITFSYADYSLQNQGQPNIASKIDILFTLRAADTNFADGLFLTNLATSSESNTAGNATSGNGIVQIQLAQPKLTIQKAIVSASSGTITTPETVNGLTFNAPGSATGYTLAGGVTLSDMGVAGNGNLGLTMNRDTVAATNINSNVTGLDAGDTARVALVINNEGGDDAFDVVFGDTLAAGTVFAGAGGLVTDAGSFLSVTRGDGTLLVLGVDYTVTTSTATGFQITLTNNFGANSAGIGADGVTNGSDIIVVTYDIALANSVAITPTTLMSSANVATFRAIATTGTNLSTNPMEAATINVTAPTVVKAFVPGSTTSTGTPEPAMVTDPVRLAIGEQATYTVTYTLPEGTIGNVTLADLLPTTGGGGGRYEIVSATLTSIGGNTTAGDVFGGNITGTLMINSAGTLSDTNGDGFMDVATFGGGGVSFTNAADNAVTAADTIVVTYVIRAVNDPVNVNGLPAGVNTGRLTYGPPTTSINSTTPIAISVPVLLVDKVLTTPTPIDASDTVTFTIDVRHAGGSLASAYDLNFSDMLPVGLTNLVVTGVMTNTALTTGNFTSDGTTVTFAAGTQGVFDLAVGQFFTLTVTANVSAAAQAGATYTNTATIDYSTLDGAVAGERTGIMASDGANVTIPVILNKSFSPDPMAPVLVSQAVVGSTITYYIIATLPEGLSNAFTITDTLQAGLTFVSGTVFSIGGVTTGGATAGGQIMGSSLAVGASGMNAGQLVTFSFGNLTDTVDGLAQGNADRVIVRIDAIVTDQTLVRGSTKVNTANQTTEVNGTPTAPSPSNSVTTTIVDPNVTISKTVNAITTAPSGDTVQYTSIISATAGANFANAQDVVFTDVLGGGAALTGGMVTIDGVVYTVNGAAIGGVSVVSSGSGFSVRFGQLATGASHTILYNATITAGAGSTVNNNAIVTYDAIDSGGASTADMQNDKNQSASDDAPLGTISIAKTITATNDANTGTAQVRAGVEDLAIGETVNVQIVLNVPAGGRTFTLADLLDLNGIGRITLNGAPTITPGAGVTFATAPVVTNPDLDGDGNADLNIAFSMAGGSGAGTITITYVATAANVAGNASGDQLNLPATLTYNASPPAGVGGTLGASISVDIVEPVLTVDKSVVTGGTPNAGDTVTYTIVVTNTGNGPAYGVTLSDPLPGSLGYTGTPTLTLSMGGGTTNPAFAGSLVVPTLLPGQTATLVYQALVGNNAVTGATVTNTVTVNSDSLPGAPVGRATPTVTDPASFVTEATQAFAKTILTAATSNADTTDTGFRAGVPDLGIGEQARVDLRIDLSEGSTQSVVISDFLTTAAGTLTFVPGSAVLSTANGVTFTGSLVPTLVDDNADGVPDRAVFNLGTVTVPGDNAGGNNFFILSYQAVAANRVENVAGDALDLNATLTTALGMLSDDASVDIVEPLMSIDKTVMTVGVPNAGDTVTYTIVVTNSGTGPAYNAVIGDPLPAGLTYVPGTATITVNGVTSAVVGSPASVTVAALQIGQTATLTYQALIGNTAVTGVPLVNTATIDTDSVPGAPTGRATPTLSDNASFVVEALQGLDKLVSATSDPNTGTGAFRAGINDLHVGETANFDLIVRLTEGTTGSVVLTDSLLTALGTLTLVGVPTIVTANGITFTGTGTAGFTLIDANADGVPESIQFDFGMVTVPGNNDPSDNFFTIRYTALVGDRPENQAGDALDLGAVLTTALGTSNASASVDIVAPQVVLTKAAMAGFVSRGDTVGYTISLMNNGTGPAYDLSLGDVLPAGLTYVPGSTTLTVGGVTTAFASPNAVTFAMLGAGQTAVVNYQVLVDPAVAAAAAYTNTATVNYDSLSGAGGRTGTTNGTATITTPTNVLGLSKAIINTSIPETGTAMFRPGNTDLNIGEHAFIDLTASFTEGTTASVVLTDQLPLGAKFQLIGAPTITFLGGIMTSQPGTPTLVDTDGDGLADRLIFNFGTVTVPVDGNPTNNLIRIRYEVVVPDLPVNTPGSFLDSPAILTSAVGNASAGTFADIVAPNVGITKTVSATPADAGDTKAYTVTLTNNGTGPAFDLTIADVLPTGLTAVAGTTVLTVGGVSTTFASPNAVPLASLGVGQSAVLTFNATIGDGVVGGTILTNSATVSYDSLSGPGGRPASGAATAAFTTAAVQTLDKAVVATSEAFTGIQYVRPGATDLTIGERATFELTTTFSEGTTNNVVITDQLVTANGVLTFTGTPTLVLANGVTITGSVTPQFIDTNGDGVPDQVRFVLGTVTIPGDNNPANNVIRIRYDAVLANAAANVAGNQVSLPATLTSSSGSLTDSEPLDIVAPVLTLAKTLAPNQPTDGQTTVFLITVGHAAGSTAAATNIVLTEMLPPGALLAGVTIIGGPAGITITGNVIRIPLLGVGETVVIQVSTSVDFASPPSGDTINMASVGFGTTTAGPPTGRNVVGVTASATLPFGNPTTSLPGGRDATERNELSSIGHYLDYRYVEEFPEIDPVYSGSATPGTFVTIDVSDETGSSSGLGTGIADAGGNWLVRLPSTTVSDRLERSRFDTHYDGARLFRSPNGELFDDRSLLGFERLGDRLSVGSKPAYNTQVVRIHTSGQSAGFGASFAPAWRDQFFSMEPGLSVEGVLRGRASEAVEGLLKGLEAPEDAGLNRFNREFLSTADF